jgi:putative Flp pilus-assembly TadE/G-like protein
VTGARVTGAGREAGQSAFLSILFLVVLIAVTAAVLDVGSWMRSDRKLQSEADAAALAAAQELPDFSALARARAVEYGSKNGGNVKSGDVTFETRVLPNDTVVVKTKRQVKGVFSGVVGVGSAEVHASAKARAGLIASARYAAPIAVDIKHPFLQCKPQPCFDQATTLDLEKTGPGAFRLLNLDQSRGGTGPGTLAGWILNGYDGYMPIDWYFSDPGAKFNSSQVKAAMQQRIGDEMLFPVYDLVQGNGANFEYHVVGWVGFLVTGFTAHGNSGTVSGHFTRVIWEGIMGSSASQANFGARSVALVE